MSKTIAYTVNDPDFFWSHRLSLAKSSIDKGYIVYLISDFKKSDIEKFQTVGIKPIDVKINRNNKNFISNFKLVYNLNKIYNKIKPEIIHQVSLKMIIFGSVSLFLTSKFKIVNAVTGMGYLFTDSRNSLPKFIILLTLRLLNLKNNIYYIFQNEIDLELFKEQGLKRNYVIIKGAGVDEHEFLYTNPEAKSKVKIVFTGRILKDKGIIDLVKAFNLLSNEIKEIAELDIYGNIDIDNPSYITDKYFKKLINHPSINWKGFSNNIKEVLKESDIYCLPSYREGLPKSIIEAMAIGRPILTTNAPGCDECVVENYNGFKVPIKNHVLLSEKLTELIIKPELRLKMGINSRKLFENEFTLSKVLIKTFNFYNQ
jgi:glycosyltransferase involved in cell wall biosynthesis